MTALNITQQRPFRRARRLLDVDGLTVALAFVAIYFVATAAMIAAV